MEQLEFVVRCTDGDLAFQMGCRVIDELAKPYGTVEGTEAVT